MASPLGYKTFDDEQLKDAAFALPSSASSSTTSDALDLGSNATKSPITVALSVPALTATMVPDTRTATYIIETSTTSNFSAVAATLLSVVQTGASSAGVGAFLRRVVIPPDCERYVRAKVTLGASTTDSSAVSGTFGAKF